jgi:hypothetical protein
MGGDDIRASDEARERTARALRHHFVAGRLTTAEFEERVERAYRARTYGELRPLLRDLPTGVARRVARTLDWVQRAVLWGHTACYAGTSAGAVGVWGLSGGGEFWPAWIILPWGALVGWHAAGSRRLSRALGRGRGRRRGAALPSAPA